MFGLSMREKIIEIIANSCRNNSNTYLCSIQSAMLLSPQVEDIALTACRNIYLVACSNSVFEIFKSMQTNVYSRITLALHSPHICGFEDIITEPLSAGGTFAIVYWAVTNKCAQTKDCMLLSHMQNDVMNEVLDKIHKVEP